MNRLLASLAVPLLVSLSTGLDAQVVPPTMLIDVLKERQWSAAQDAIQHGADVRARAGDGSTPLHWAIHFDQVELAGRIIKAGADVNATTDLGVTPLALACENASAPAAQLLLRAGAGVSTPPGTVPVLMTAARSGSVEIVTALLARGADPNAAEPVRHQTALMWAVANGHPAVVAVLLGAGARVNSRTRADTVVTQSGNRYAGVASREEGLASRGVRDVQVGGSTALLFAARTGDAKSARLLVDAGADVNETSPDGASALVTAVHSGQRDVATFLIERAADVNAIGAGYAALHAAVLRGDAPLVSLLLDKGANIEAAVQHGTPSRRYSHDYALNDNFAGATPLWLAARFAERSILRELIRRGAKPLVTTRDGTNAAMAVITAGVESGPSASDRRDRRLDPLEVAALAENRDTFEQEALETVRLLIEAGIDVNAANDAGDRAVHLAASRAFPAVIRFLAEHGARLDVRNTRGLTPLALTAPRRGTDESQALRKANELLRSLGASE